MASPLHESALKIRGLLSATMPEAIKMKLENLLEALEAETPVLMYPAPTKIIMCSLPGIFIPFAILFEPICMIATVHADSLSFQRHFMCCLNCRDGCPWCGSYVIEDIRTSCCCCLPCYVIEAHEGPYCTPNCGVMDEVIQYKKDISAATAKLNRMHKSIIDCANSLENALDDHIKLANGNSFLTEVQVSVVRDLISFCRAGKVASPRWR